MKYFTPEWHGFGDADLDLSAEEEQAVVAAYRQHVAGLLPSMPPELRDLVQGRISLHDGVVLDARLDGAAKELRLLLRCGDLQVGYYDLELRYGAVRRLHPASAQLDELISLNA